MVVKNQKNMFLLLYKWRLYISLKIIVNVMLWLLKIRDGLKYKNLKMGPAHNVFNINVKQKDSNFIPFVFHNFGNYDCHMFFKKLVDLKKDKIKFEIIPKTNEEYISVRHGCIRFIDSYRFLSESLDKLVKSLDEDDFKILKKEYPDKWQYLNKKLA